MQGKKHGWEWESWLHSIHSTVKTHGLKVTHYTSDTYTNILLTFWYYFANILGPISPLLVHWSIGPSVHWSIWIIGPLIHWCNGLWKRLQQTRIISAWSKQMLMAAPLYNFSNRLQASANFRRNWRKHTGGIWNKENEKLGGWIAWVLFIRGWIGPKSTICWHHRGNTEQRKGG